MFCVLFCVTLELLEVFVLFDDIFSKFSIFVVNSDFSFSKDCFSLSIPIAKELAHRGAEPTAVVHLAAGLPLTSFGRDKKKFRAYLLRDGKPVPFRYEGIGYTVTIAEVSLFPQGYAAVLTQSELLDEPSVIVADIGGWTVDLMRLDNRVPKIGRAHV